MHRPYLKQTAIMASGDGVLRGGASVLVCSKQAALGQVVNGVEAAPVGALPAKVHARLGTTRSAWWQHDLQARWRAVAGGEARAIDSEKLSVDDGRTPLVVILEATRPSRCLAPGL